MINETDLYKEEYLKYKRDYLILKQQISGAKKFNSNYTMYIILDENSYNAIVRKVIHYDLSIVNLDLELIGSALKINEKSSDI